MGIQPDRPQSIRLISVLTVESLRDLFRHRSFLALIFLVLALDRLLHEILNPASIKQFISQDALLNQLPQVLFEMLPAVLLQWLSNPWILIILGGLFLLKQLISLWPSNSLRGWHSRSHDHRLLTSLTSLKAAQMAWDFCALSLLLGMAAAWSGISFVIFRTWWQVSGTRLPTIFFIASIAVICPLLMAGFSYSSKLAVLKECSPKEKMGLFLMLFTCPGILGFSWLFFLGRIVLEGLFVAIIPLGALLYIDHFVLRTLLACASATPAYSYLKMVTFKFFLFIYRDYDPVRREFNDYFARLHGPPARPLAAPHSASP